VYTKEKKQQISFNTNCIFQSFTCRWSSGYNVSS